MTAVEIANIADINIERLQKGLKQIGFDVSKFDHPHEKDIPILTELFKQASKLDPKHATKIIKMNLRSSFDKIIKSNSIQKNSQATPSTPNTPAPAKGKKLSINELKASRSLNSGNIKLGRVRRFSAERGYGYIQSFDDKKDCFVHLSKVVTVPIIDNDLVLFETIDSRKKEGELDAIKVSNRIPIFISNKVSSPNSFGYALLRRHAENEYQLIEKFETGFAIAKVNQTGTTWKVTLFEKDSFPKIEILFHGKKLLTNLLMKPEENKHTIQSLISTLKANLFQDELDLLYEESFVLFERKNISKLHSAIEAVKGFNEFTGFIEERKKSLNKISFVLWAKGELEKLPDIAIQNGSYIWYSEILPNLDWIKLQQILLKLLWQEASLTQIRNSYLHLIEKGWNIYSDEEFETVLSFLKMFTATFPEIKLVEDNFSSESNHHFIRLLQQGFLDDLSLSYFLTHIAEIKIPEKQAEFIESLPTSKIVGCYNNFPDLLSYKEKYILKLTDSEFAKIDYLCFDLESDGEKIKEFAWTTSRTKKSHLDFQKREDGILEMLAQINSGCIVIGQNVKEFDLSILSKFGNIPAADFIWDTLEIEMLLNPGRFSYGLKTQHNAVADSETTLALFKNQLSRIILSYGDLGLMGKLLPLKIREIIDEISLNPDWKLLNISFFEKQSNDFFRPNPTIQHIPEPIFTKLKEKIEETGSKVIIAPEYFWSTLSYQFDIAYYSENKRSGLYLSTQKIKTALNDDEFLKAILVKFINLCSLRAVQPYFNTLPVPIQLKLTPEQIILVCDYCEIDFQNLENRTVFIKPTDIEFLKEAVAKKRDISVLVVGNELFDLTNKIQMGQDYDFVTIFDCLKHQPIWLQLSGGRSFISLQKSDCLLLGINEFPEFIQNIWLEKYEKGKFRVWCNLDFERCIADLKIENLTYLPLGSESINKINAFVVRPDARLSQYAAEQKRVNPESLYRKMYWVYQFKLFDGWGVSGNPKVLVLNDSAEIDRLYPYARHKGYFIPDTNASLARQLELLHSHKSSRKLLLTSFQDLNKVISSNYAGPLDFIWDSFLLQEKLQMFKGKHLQESDPIADQHEDDYQEGGDFQQKEYDIFSLIKLHKPLIDYYYKILNDNHPGSQLYLCDTRLTDYFGIEKSLKTNVSNIQMWFSESEYNLDKELANAFFPPDKESAKVDFDVAEAKEILRHIFLVHEEGGDPYPWHDYQHPCLDNILPAKRDLLVSLPTGAGKSVLFQAPALFRSAFSGKLSIVISPLRALMHDQVEGLWNKGFYSNVEYLSGDKSQAEIKDIFRRISGGEITLLYITPERFRSRSFENCLLTRLEADNGLEFVVFDEAHCISQWGQEFRPDYLNASRKIAGFSGTFLMRKLLFSATISEQVFEEISVLMPGVNPIEGSEKSYNPVRDHIKMDFKHNVVADDRLIEVGNYLKSGGFNPKLSRAIVFVKSRKKVEECALIMPENLIKIFGNSCDFSEKVGAFHAGMDAEDRKEIYEKFKNGEIVILFATKAFGMGMDIPNIHFVTHYSPPGTFEDFLQEVGRAGRNEKQRVEAGFNNINNPIKTLCLTVNNDFGKLKEQLHESRISWHEIKDIKTVVEEYIAKFKALIPDDTIPVAIPFNLYSVKKESTEEDSFDNKFRMALHWLERLQRIKLGYFTITHLELQSASLKKLSEQVKNCPDKDSETVCKALLTLVNNLSLESEVVQISVASLRNISKLSLSNLFNALINAHNVGILKLLQTVVIEPTKIRQDEIIYYTSRNYETKKYPALQATFSLTYKILKLVPANDAKIFDGDELEELMKAAIYETIDFRILPWTLKEKDEEKIKEKERYVIDISKKRSKHAFSIIRLLGKTRHETKMEKISDGARKVRITQSVFNGFHKTEEWTYKINQLEKDCIKVLEYVSKRFLDRNIKCFNWADIISELAIKGGIQYFNDILFILSVLGYCRNGSMLPTGIEVYLSSLEAVKETELQSSDKKIFEEFDETRKVRELKLIALEVLAGFQKNKQADISKIRERQDSFIRKYFVCNSLESLLRLLQEELPPNDPLLIKWRGDAIHAEEDRLNNEQREVYEASINQHINVIAGPGSGKTHTLTLRVARLVHHIGIMPEEILVLAYNRAVVSELKERLDRLFRALGYGNLARRIKIFTFHGLAKKYCQEAVADQDFDQWEKVLLERLCNSPGQIMNQLAPLKHILVDEFQDITQVRIGLLQKLNELTKAYLFIIGDPNQSIYGYERIKEGGSISPWPYYQKVLEIFTPETFFLYDNHRSYPDILTVASNVLTLPAQLGELLPRPTKVPDNKFIKNYAEVIDRTQQKIDWWSKIEGLINERVGEKRQPYKQIAIMFRTNNEVYRGFQKLKSLNLSNVRIRIQGSLPYEFTRIRECHSVILFLKSKSGQQIQFDFRKLLSEVIKEQIKQNPNWNDFYLRLMHALILDYLNDQDDIQDFDSLLDFITELTYKDDGQLYKIYEKYIKEVSNDTQETEIVLTTMHKVKGLEFDCVIVPPSFSNLPLGVNEELAQGTLSEQFEEERRLAFVAYTRARYRLLVFRHLREIALSNNCRHTVSADAVKKIGIPVHPGIKKLNIGWAANSYNFNNGRVNDYIKSNIKSGDFISINKRKIVPNNGNPFFVYEIYKVGTEKAIGRLSSDIGRISEHPRVDGFVVNEIVVWSYEDTEKFDRENPGKNYAANWCAEAKEQGYIYLIDFAGFGLPYAGGNNIV